MDYFEVRYRYWMGNGELQEQYNTMLKAEEAGTFTFAKVSYNLFYSYHRYYNDGDIPGWARGKREYLEYHFPYGTKLNDNGEAELERRANDRVSKEWKRFCRSKPVPTTEEEPDIIQTSQGYAPNYDKFDALGMTTEEALVWCNMD